MAQMGADEGDLTVSRLDDSRSRLIGAHLRHLWIDLRRFAGQDRRRAIARSTARPLALHGRSNQ